MTNEEKAREIEGFFESPNLKDANFLMCYQSARKMAEWKDGEFKKYLERRKKDYVASIHTDKDLYDYGYIDAIDEILGEFFEEDFDADTNNDE